MKRLLIVLLIALMSVGCSNKNSQQSSQTTPENSQTSEKNLTIEDVEGYWECKSDEMMRPRTFLLSFSHHWLMMT